MPCVREYKASCMPGTEIWFFRNTSPITLFLYFSPYISRIINFFLRNHQIFDISSKCTWKRIHLNFHKDIYFCINLFWYIRLLLFSLFERNSKDELKNKKSYVRKFKDVKYPNKLHFTVTCVFFGSLFQFL